MLQTIMEIVFFLQKNWNTSGPNKNPHIHFWHVLTPIFQVGDYVLTAIFHVGDYDFQS